MSIPFEPLVPILQTAIGPVILISGVGLLLLSMTNRYARVIDRTRALALLRRADSAARRAGINAQLQIMARRARLIRLAIALAATSVLLAAVLIILLFCTALFHWQTGWFIAVVFIASMMCLIGSLGVFLRDINVSLHALELEVEEPV